MTHPRFRRDGVSPDLHAVLAAIAAGKGLAADAASGCLATGDDARFRDLERELRQSAHPLWKALPWRHLPRGLAIDEAVHKTPVRRGTPLSSLSPDAQLAVLNGSDPPDFAAAVRRAARRVTDAEITAAIQRATHRAVVLRSDAAAEAALDAFAAAVDRHRREPHIHPHPDGWFWQRHPVAVAILPPPLLLRLRSSHFRRYGVPRRPKGYRALA